MLEAYCANQDKGFFGYEIWSLFTEPPQLIVNSRRGIEVGDVIKWLENVAGRGLAK